MEWPGVPKSIPSPTWIERQLAKIKPGTYEQYLAEAKPVHYTDFAPFLSGGMHAAIVGRTGAGKTTLLLQLLSALCERGFTILARDDGNLEGLYLLPKFPMRIWKPRGFFLEIEADQNNKFEVSEFDPQKPLEILDHVFEYPFNLVVFDKYCVDPGLSAEFYARLFKYLIFKCMQTPQHKKKKLIFSIDELNDLIQTRGNELTSKHASVRSLIEYNIRKLRKHLVTLIASTHRLQQLGISVRSQFSYVFMKQSYGYDVYDMLSKCLVTQNNKVFWATLKDLTTMDQQYFYMFDYKNNFDRYIYKDIERPVVKYNILGHLDEEDEDRKKTDTIRKVLVAYYMGQGLTAQEIAEKLNICERTIYRDKKKMVEEWGLSELKWAKVPPRWRKETDITL